MSVSQHVALSESVVPRFFSPGSQQTRLWGVDRQEYPSPLLETLYKGLGTSSEESPRP